MPRPARPSKRPYVRPRIGYSFTRSLWYAVAFVALLALAFLIPRTSAPAPVLEGDWVFETQVPAGDLAAGRTILLLHGGHYTLRTASADGALRVEFGAATENGDEVLLEPVEAIAVDGQGRGTITTEPAPHAFRLRYREAQLVIEADEGPTVEGERRPFVPAATGTGAERR